MLNPRYSFFISLTKNNFSILLFTYSHSFSSGSSSTDKRKFVSNHIESLIFAFGRLPGPLNIRIVNEAREVKELVQNVAAS